MLYCYNELLQYSTSPKVESAIYLDLLIKRRLIKSVSVYGVEMAARTARVGR